MPTIEPPSGAMLERCSQCNDVGGPLLACDDELNHHQFHKGGPKPRFCNNCMITKKVKVFWPVDESWYIGVVISFDANTGEHELRYPDGDTEWVKIGDIISAAAAGAGGSSKNMDGRLEPTGNTHETAGPHRNAQRPVEHRGLSPPRPSAPPHSHPPQHHQMPPETDGQTPDYRGSTSNIPGQPPAYYGGQFPPGGPGSAYPSQTGPGFPSMPGNPGGSQPYGVSGPPSQSALGPQHHPTMPPPHMIPYGMFPQPVGSAVYPGGPMFPHHPHMGGPPQPYGMPPGAIGAHPYFGSSGRASSPQNEKDDDENDDENAAGSGNDPSGTGRSKKTGPKPWTKEEDTLLLTLVHSMQWPMKWTIVAQSLPDRTGKQCRERYVNHLNPRLKASDWNPVEDSTIFHLYNTIGSHWAKMSKIIPGRTDNGIKNRFHNIRRQYEREDSHRLRLSSVEDFPDEIRLDRLRKFPEHLEGKSTQLWDMKGAIGVLAAQSVLGGSGVNNDAGNRSGSTGGATSRFGPFRKPSDEVVELCVRCGLIVPSVHTGWEICAKTGWCHTCTQIPPNVSGNLLRECLNLRRAEATELSDIIEAFEEYFVPSEENTWPYKKSNVRPGMQQNKDKKVKVMKEELPV